MASDSRVSITEKAKRAVWVRAGGRCFLCNTDLLTGDVGDEAIRGLDELAGSSLGDAAHLVGAKDSAASPRGKSDAAIGDRNSADNLVLACPSHHRQIDSGRGVEMFHIDTLRELKRVHEERISFATSVVTEDRSTPVRILGGIEGGPVQALANDCAQAILRHERRLPGWRDGHYREGIEIDLRGLPGRGADYYRGGRLRIDDGLADIRREVRRDRLDRISLFAAAKLPLLLYLGYELDDTFPVTVYQRDKLSQSWTWPAENTYPRFDVTLPQTGAHEEGLVVVAVTADPDIRLLPDGVASLPAWSLRAEHPGDTVIDSPSALRDFEVAARRLYTELDNSGVAKIHLVVAAPVSAAVIVGRVLPHSHHAPVVVYERTPDGYAPALELRT